MSNLTNIWKRLSINNKGLIALALPLIILLSSIAFLYQRELAAQSAEKELQSAITELAKIQAIHAQLAEAATGVRGFLLTSKDDFLKRYYQSRQSIPIEIKQLKQTSNDKDLLAHLLIMEPIVKQKLAGMEKMLAEGPLMSKDEFISLLISQKHVLDRIRKQIDLMRERETVLITQKQIALQEVRKNNLHLTFIAALIGIISALISINFYFSDIVKRVLHLRDNAALLAEGAALKPTPKAADEIGTLAESLEAAATLIARKQYETEQARADAEASNTAKTQFLSRTSHELRTPLNAILGFAQILKTDLPKGTFQQSATHIQAAGQHLLKLINDVLNISRIESGEVGISINAYNLNDITREAVALLAQAALKKNISLKVSIPEQLSVLADRDKLLQILINLISNAIKYGPSNADVSIWSDSAEEHVSIYIRDEGAGIPENVRSRLFTPFDRLGAEHSSIEGVGLGLALSKELASAMKGNIGLANEGSTFKLSLPISPTNVDKETLQVATIEPLPTTNKTQHILYVEDSASNIALVKTLLRRAESIELHTASTVKSAQSFINEHTIDMLLLDVHLPDGPSDTLMSHLRSLPHHQDTPIIILSAEASPSTIQHLKQIGANEYLEKPIDINLLNQTIKRYLL